MHEDKAWQTISTPHTTARKGRHHAGLSLPLLVVWLVAGTTALVMLPVDEQVALQSAAVATSAMALAVLLASHRQTGNAANPLGLTMIVLVVHYPFHALAMVDSYTTTSLLGFERFEYLTYAVLVGGLGMLSMHIGFASRKVGRFTLALRRLDLPIEPLDRQTTIKLFIVLAIAFGSKLALGAWRGFLYINLETEQTPLPAAFLLWLLSGLSVLVGIHFFIVGLKSNIRWRTFVGLGIVLFEALWGLVVTGSRYQFLIPIVSLVLAWGMVWRPFRLRELTVMVAILFLGVVPLSSAYKAAYLSRIGDIQREGFSVDIIAESFEATDEENLQQQTWDELIALRLHGGTSLALIMRYVPEKHPYMLGVPYLFLPLDLIVPRFVWPDKPTVREFAALFPSVFWNKQRGDGSAVKASQFGELWANLHILGVLLGSWVWGRILRFLNNGIQLGGAGSLLGVAAAASVMPEHIINTPEGDLLQALSALMKVYVIWVCLVWFLAPARRSRSASTQRAPDRHPGTASTPQTRDHGTATAGRQ
jgi:hypothetical protein